MINKIDDETLYQIMPMTTPIAAEASSVLHQSPAVLNSFNNKRAHKSSKDDANLFSIDHYRNKKLKKQRRHDIQKFFNESANIKQKYSASNNTKSSSNDGGYNKINGEKNSKKKKEETACCKFTFIFDPNGRLSYWMSK